jgi:hypothetical protein
MRHHHPSGPRQLSSIMPLVTCFMNDHPDTRAELAFAAEDGPRPGPAVRRAGARQLRIIAGGTAAAGLPAGSALTWVIERRPGAIFLIFAAAVVAAAAAILRTTLAMYEARQETRRTEIECHSASTIAAALARYIDNTHRSP